MGCRTAHHKSARMLLSEYLQGDDVPVVCAHITVNIHPAYWFC